MEVRDAVEADAEALATLADAPTDVMRNLVHDRTVRVATADGEGTAPEEPRTAPELEGFVSFDVRDSTVHVTQVGGTRRACELLLAEPTRFAEREGMDVELLVPEEDDDTQWAAEAAGFDDRGPGPTFEGRRTIRYWQDPG